MAQVSCQGGGEVGTTLQGGSHPGKYLLGARHRVRMALHQVLKSDSLQVTDIGDLQKETRCGQKVRCYPCSEHSWDSWGSTAGPLAHIPPPTHTQAYGRNC